MREIKFRAFDGDKMIYDINVNKDGRMMEMDYGNYCGSFSYHVMQYAGLKDLTGKEIYEGDIVKDRFDRIMQVQWWNYRLCWVAITETNFHHADLYDWCERDENYEQTDTARVKVIGNIYQNKSLLHLSR